MPDLTREHTGAVTNRRRGLGMLPVYRAGVSNQGLVRLVCAPCMAATGMSLGLMYNTIDVFDYGAFCHGVFIQSEAVDRRLIRRVEMAYASLPTVRPREKPKRRADVIWIQG